MDKNNFDALRTIREAGIEEAWTADASIRTYPLADGVDLQALGQVGDACD